MAQALASSIEQLKRQFCSNNAHLPEAERQQAWLNIISTLPSQPSPVDHVPRSMSCSTPDMSQYSV